MALPSPTPVAEPYEPPPFTRFPDEPADLPPLDPPSGPAAWRAALRAARAAVRGIRLRVVARVDAPIDVAGGLEIVFPWRARVGASLGFLPKSVGRAGNDALVDHGVYGPEVGAIVGASMERIVVGRVHVAVRPWTKHGFVAGVGYARASLSGQARVDRVATAVGMPIPEEVDSGDVRVAIESRVSLVDIELGWEWRWRGHWMFGASAGAVLVTKSRTKVTSERPLDANFEDVAVRAAQRLDSAYHTYGKAPFVSSFVAYEL